MKKILFSLLLFSMNFTSFGQVIDHYAIVLNNDSSSLNATVKDKKIILNVQKSDILTITFEEIKSDITKKRVTITSESNSKEVLIGTFDKKDIRDNSSYALDISFIKQQLEIDHIYSIQIMDEKGVQVLLRFKLIKGD